MKTILITQIQGIRYLWVLTALLLFARCENPASLNAVILSDQEESGENIKKILEYTGLFDVDIRDGAETDYSEYDVVVLNVKKADWSEKELNSFAEYVKTGGGVVVLNSANNAFSNWPQFSDISGVQPSDAESNGTFEYEVMNGKQEHPILKGLPGNWLHVEDYMLFNTKSLSGETEVLATAKADTTQGGGGEIIPVLFTVKYGEGRVFNTTMGKEPEAEKGVGFITTLQRGAEWAATGVVSQEVPVDFPSFVSTHEWPDLKPLTLDEILTKASTYEIGKSRKYLSDFSVRIRYSDGKPETYAAFESKILDFLNSEATVDSKIYMCRELSWIGSEKSIPVLNNLINDKELSEAAAYALQRLNL